MVRGDAPEFEPESRADSFSWIAEKADCEAELDLFAVEGDLGANSDVASDTRLLAKIPAADLGGLLRENRPTGPADRRTGSASCLEM